MTTIVGGVILISLAARVIAILESVPLDLVVDGLILLAVVLGGRVALVTRVVIGPERTTIVNPYSRTTIATRSIVSVTLDFKGLYKEPIVALKVDDETTGKNTWLRVIAVPMTRIDEFVGPSGES